MTTMPGEFLPLSFDCGMQSCYLIGSVPRSSHSLVLAEVVESVVSQERHAIATARRAQSLASLSPPNSMNGTFYQLDGATQSEWTSNLSADEIDLEHPEWGQLAGESHIEDEEYDCVVIEAVPFALNGPLLSPKRSFVDEEIERSDPCCSVTEDVCGSCLRQRSPKSPMHKFSPENRGKILDHNNLFEEEVEALNALSFSLDEAEAEIECDRYFTNDTIEEESSFFNCSPSESKSISNHVLSPLALEDVKYVRCDSHQSKSPKFMQDGKALDVAVPVFRPMSGTGLDSEILLGPSDASETSHASSPFSPDQPTPSYIFAPSSPSRSAIRSPSKTGSTTPRTPTPIRHRRPVSNLLSLSPVEDAKSIRDPDNRNEVFDTLISRFLDIDRPMHVIPTVTANMVAFFDLQGALSKLASFITYPEDDLSELNAHSHETLSAKRSFRAMQLLASPPRLLIPCIVQHQKELATQLAEALRPSSKANLDHWKSVVGYLFPMYSGICVALLEIPDIIHKFLQSLHRCQVQDAFTILLQKPRFQEFLVHHHFITQLEKKIILTDDPCIADELCRFYIMLFDNMDRQVNNYICLEEEFNRGGHVLQLFQQSIARPYECNINALLEIMQVVTVSDFDEHFMAVLSQALVDSRREQLARINRGTEIIINLSAFSVPAFSTNRMALVIAIRRLVEVDPWLANGLSIDAWKVLADWFFEYRFNNIYHGHFAAIFRELLRLDEQTIQNPDTKRVVLKATRFVRRGINAFRSSERADHRGHLLLLFEILLFSSDPVITKYLNSFALWREFVDELRSALEVIQITPKTFAPRPPKGAKKRSESASSGSDDPAVLVENVLLCLATDVLSTTSSSSPPFNVLDSGSLVGDRICAPESEVFAHEDKENATLNRMDLVGKNDRRWSEVDMTKAGLVKYASSCGLRPRIPAPGLSKQGMDFVLRLEASRPSCPGVGLAVGEL